MIAANLLRNSGMNLTLFSSTSANAATIAVPADIKAGDLAVMWNYAAGTPVAAVSPGTGWTQLSNLTLANRRVTVYYKILNGTESFTFVGMNDTFESLFLNIFRNTKAPISSVAATVLGQEITTGDPSGIDIIPGSTTRPCITIAFASAGGNGHTWATPTGATAITTHNSLFYTGYYNIWNSTAPPDDAPPYEQYDVNDDPGAENSLQVFRIGINQ